MAVLCLVLYGSCAREDNDEFSDVDLFAITDDSFYRMSIQNKANMACYPKDYAELRAKSGDLFFWHLILEGKVLYDPDGYFELIKASFQKKPSYDLEINNAKDIAWMLVDLCDSTEEYVMINKRIAWCVRTILIAKSADFGTPVFSKKQLIKFCDDSSVERILSNKESFFRNSNAASDLEVFLKRFSLFRSQDGRTKDDYMELFRSTDNRMGIKTLSALINGAGLSDYL